jgi:magnesium and cobalt transporter
MKLEELLKVFKDSGHSRLPVYKDTQDNPQGLLHLKDLALKYGFNGKVTRFSIKQMLRPLLYVPPSMTVDVLLQKMQADRIHMALVIDEYGGVDGLVTFEDLIEQIVGEIEDEHDTAEESYWVEEKPGVYLCHARAPLDEFEKILNADLASTEDDEDIDTLGGLVTMMAGRVPVRGEVIKHPDGFEFEIVDADPRRIKKLRVCRSQKR